MTIKNENEKINGTYFWAGTPEDPQVRGPLTEEEFQELVETKRKYEQKQANKGIDVV